MANHPRGKFIICLTCVHPLLTQPLAFSHLLLRFSGQPLTKSGAADRQTESQMIDYAEFLLWVDRNCLEDVAERGLLILRSVLETRVQENVDVVAMFKNCTPENQVVDFHTFYALVTNLGLLYCRTSIALLFDALLEEGASAIDVSSLLQLLVAPYPKSQAMVS